MTSDRPAGDRPGRRSLPALGAADPRRPARGGARRCRSPWPGGRGGRLHVALRDAPRVRRRRSARPGRSSPAGTCRSGPASLALADDGATLLLVGGIDGQVAALDPRGRVVRDLADRAGPGAGPAAAAAAARPSPSRWDAACSGCSTGGGGGSWPSTRSRSPPGRWSRRPTGGSWSPTPSAAGSPTWTRARPGASGSCAFEGVNLLALAISGDGKELLIAHMYQEDAVPITAANIDAGRVLSSRLSAVRLADLDGERRARTRRSPPPPGSRSTARSTARPTRRRWPSRPTATRSSSPWPAPISSCSRTTARRGSPPRGADDLLPLGHNQRLEVVEVGRSPVAVVARPVGHARRDRRRDVRHAHGRSASPTCRGSPRSPLGPDGPPRTAGAARRGRCSSTAGGRTTAG